MGMSCVKNVPIKLKGKVINIDQANNDIWSVCRSEKKDENRLHAAGRRMLRWIRGKTSKGHIRNQIILFRDCPAVL